MAVKTTLVYFVFRKPNPGNYSIEAIYNSLIIYWQRTSDTPIRTNKIRLKHNFDLLSFLSCLFKSIIGTIKTAHITGGCNYMVMAFPFSRRLLTVHDVFYLTTSQNKKGWLYKLLYYNLPVYFSHSIIAVTQQTKNDLVSLYPKAAEKITVIANPLCLESETKKIAAESAKPKQHIKVLQIGSKSLKNYENLLKATKDLAVSYIFVHGDSKNIRSLLSKYKLLDRATLYSNISKAALIELYLEADILYFASFAEGFGLPLLEARAVHLPIITSNIEPMKSLAPHAFHVNPRSVEDIKSAFTIFIEQGVLEQDLVTDANTLTAYTVENIAKRYQSLYCLSK